MGDVLISKAAAIDALKRAAYWQDAECKIAELPAVDAIPAEWLHRKRKEALQEGMRPDEVDAVEMVLWMWQKEQEG